MIPKVIHYCWFGDQPMPEKAVACMESWKKHCPDYQIVRWNEDNFDINSCAYTREAAAAGKWAFVSDYVRFKVIYEQGGLYFDTDVELLKNMDDIIENGPFFGFESESPSSINPGIGMGAYAGHPFYKKVLDTYATMHFFREDGTPNQQTIVALVSGLLKPYGIQDGTVIRQAGDISIYPKDWFCPMNYYTGELHLSDHSHSIHHFLATWHDEKEQKAHALGQKVSRVMGVKAGKMAEKTVGMPHQISKKVSELGVGGTARFLAKRFMKPKDKETVNSCSGAGNGNGKEKD